MTDRIRVLCRAVVSVVLVAALTACAGSASGQGSSETKPYTRPQIMLIVANERNRYRDVYTEQIWQVQADDEGTTFGEYLIGEIRSFLGQMQVMNLLADEQGLTLTSRERDSLKELAALYYASLTEADLDYIGADEDDVYTMYEAYYRANRLVDALTEDVDLEISDSEARVMTVQELTFDEPSAAQEAYLLATTEGADFSAVAASLTGEAASEILVGRGERSKEYDDAVFGMEDGQICEPFLDDGVWYLVRCVRDYEEKETLEREERLSLQRKNQAFRRSYDAFAAEHAATYDEAAWEDLSLTEGEDSSTTDFFERYQEMIEQAGG
ncbi:MAG: peptidyl-prolyl cis-trans isomerase [Clostridiales bacterium]|nr:peptidyl-prolyl cis-trans isomerase [Clostridiales bacterium]